MAGEGSIEVQEPRRRRRWFRRVLIALLILLAVAVAVSWTLRERLASGYIEGELDRLDVEARYDIGRIGLDSQILENVVIGDVNRPDATIRHLEVQLVMGWDGPAIGRITARGVRLRGRVAPDGTLSLGAIDKLLPEPSGAPFELPDQEIDMADAAIGLATPAGPVGLAVEGQGNLADGFRGRLAAAARALNFGGCALFDLHADVGVSVAARQPTLRGPVALRRLACGDIVAERPVATVNVQLSPGLDTWRGGAATRVAVLGSGAGRLTGVGGRLTLEGNALRTAGRAELSAETVTAEVARAGATQIAGPYAASLTRGALTMTGEADAAGVVLADRTLAGAATPLRSAAGTPLGPIGASLADALVRAGRNGNLAASFQLAVEPDRGAVNLRQVRYAAASGARLLADGGSGATFGWPDGGVRLDGDFAVSGGGFPESRFTLRQIRSGAPLQGTGRVAAMRAGDARLALGEIRFTAAGGDTSFRTVASLDGPIADGRVRGLTLPLAGRFGRGGFVLGESCVAAAFQSLEVQTLRLNAARVPLCPAGRAIVWQAPSGALQAGAELRNARFAGRLGSSPIALAASRVRASLDGLSASALSVRLGGESGVTRLDIASLSGRFARGGIDGAFGGLGGEIAGVPLVASEGRGDWRFAGSRLELTGAMTIADTQDPLRFEPLAARDFRLTLADSRIHATGALVHPAGGNRVALATIDHNLGSGAGSAVLDVEGLRFGRGLQPEALTPLTVGVVALVDGTLTGQGRIAWDEAGVRSSGTFATQGMNLAAPFGPVQGLTTTLEFTDLLGLVSAPDQRARVDLIQAGIEVYDGEIQYEIRPNYGIAIESARWPFSGGTLTLEPTLLDFSRETTKYLTFRVDGLDAARFVEMMEFGNIAATGTFDGVVPMEFDETGGGIIRAGRLTARPEGGTLSYVGELTDRDLGAYGILAFNALKSLSYDRFDLTLNGALDGEFITVIDLDGIARDPAGTVLPSGGGIPQMVAGRVFSQLARIPFEFNIRIQGQFRALIATARSFSDPSVLVQSAIRDQLNAAPAVQENPVQDEESEPMR